MSTEISGGFVGGMFLGAVLMMVLAVFGHRQSPDGAIPAPADSVQVADLADSVESLRAQLVEHYRCWPLPADSSVRRWHGDR